MPISGDHMKILAKTAKTVFFVIACSWLTAFCVMAACWTIRLYGGYLNEYINLLITAFIISLCGFTAITAVYYLFLNLSRLKRQKLLKENGYNDKYYSHLERRAQKSKRTGKMFDRNLLLAEELIDGERFDRAEEVLENAQALSNTKFRRARLCAVYLKLYSMNRQENLAGEYFAALCSSATSYFEKRGVGGEIAYSAALYYFLTQDYIKAQEQAQKAVKLSVGTKKNADAELFLALCLLKNEEYAEAKRVTEKASGKVFTPSQIKDLKSLMTAVEEAYGL